ncbi:AAA domain-containing protein [Aeoliella sp.]|uniref:AAA domain-containing protein n=1 Tax=Aeoliella sp. TaxID=2795800 RepID=UPI003CCBEDA9
MTKLADFMQSRFDGAGLSTEDALASFLPLAREVNEAHAAGLVAPLEGIDDLQVEGVQIWFEEAKRREVRRANAEVRKLQAEQRSAVEVVSELRVTTEVDDGSERRVDLAIIDTDQPITRPAYLPGYQSWEHRMDCHDPVTDIFSLGMILASLACGLDFRDTDDLDRFVAHRKNLFTLAPDLHPVVARVVVRMTQVERRSRAQDLSSLVRTLETYRDQEVDLLFDLTNSAEFESSSTRDKQTVILTKLRERLFELSRRNKLLHFKPTLQSVNLTQSSVPLSFDIKSIRPDQILTWTDDLQREVASSKPISLNKYLNFTEVLYLPSQLEKLIAEAKRDQAEYGFAQLRLVVCFLHWANLKEKPAEQYDSPLVLLPVQLRKKKGIRDTFYLDTLSTDAEINPVVRHQFKQLYDIDLPETIDLSKGSLDALFELLREKINASETAITLTKVDRPRIALIHEKARRRLDQYRKRARLAGRGIRKFLDFDYSYDPANFHPLGIKLFSSKVRPTETHLRDVIEDKPRPRNFAVEPDTPVSEPVVEQERQFYSLQSGGETNPYEWTFDLCSVTLANFKYRRMSLVRDYEALLDDGMTNPAFEAAFSLVPRPLDDEPANPRPLEERFDVVPCDPTQAAAIAEAGVGKSFIIQGPPGTGKSQTITNLIADYVARGKRVLFVCEKRAAIDVVYARLRQCGLADLCCLIHDSQTDKKEFVMDLKQTYEGLLGKPAKSKNGASREKAVQQLSKALRSLQHFDESMQTSHNSLGVTPRQLLDSCIQLREALPNLDVLAKESLPDYADWLRSKASIRRFERALADVGGGSILAKHPMRLLSPRLASVDHPLEQIATACREATAQLGSARQALERCGIPGDRWETLARATTLVEYACRVKPLSDSKLMNLFDTNSDPAKWLDTQLGELGRNKKAIADAVQTNQHWVERLSPDETITALDQAVGFEKSMLSWLKPSWWRLRGVLNRCYYFGAHKIRPSWSRVLEQLAEEHNQRKLRESTLQDTAEHLKVEPDDVEHLIDTLVEIKTSMPEQPKWLSDIHAALIKSPQSAEIVGRVSEAREALDAATAQLAILSDSAAGMTWDEVQQSLEHISGHLDSVSEFLDCLREIGTTPEDVASTLRSLPHSLSAIEAAVADHGLAQLYRQDRELERFTGRTHRTLARRLEQQYDRWLGLNALDLRKRVRDRFQASIRISEQSATKLSNVEKEFKQRYNRGRRELEHEFGKQMRYKAIRDLVSDESGDVINDLKPIWLMSPLSVSDTLPLSPDRFDVVIFDEASQITLEEAVPALFRASQSIIVGDEMQLPPTDFFSSKQASEEEEELLIESDGELVQYDLDSGSFLSHAAKNLPSTMLGWHYRSRSESLISFSNWAFYDGRLLTVPEEALAGIERQAIVAAGAEDGPAGAAATLERPISYHRLSHGVYDKRRNRAEAEYIAEMVRELLLDEARNTMGIVAFSEAQQDEIEQALTRLGQDDKVFREALEAEFEREDDGQFVGLLVKNLENIQGDERDIIILSICYGHPPTGKMRMNFGPINKSGGEKRLNVAFSRAKRHMAIVSSIDSTDITNDYNDGANCLKNYLRYAEAISVGDSSVAERITHGLSRWNQDDETPNLQKREVVAEQLAEALQKAGFTVDCSVGQSHFRCDLAVYRPGDSIYRLGVLIDGQKYYEQNDLLERDMMRPRLLRAFGWRIAQVFAKDWYADPDREVSQLLALMSGDVLPDEVGLDTADNEEQLDKSTVAEQAPPREPKLELED